MRGPETANSSLGGHSPEDRAVENTQRLLPGVSIEPLTEEYVEVYIALKDKGQLKIPQLGISEERQFIQL
jgi:hypothetical protein